MRRYCEDVRIALVKLPAAHYKTLYLDPPWAEVGGGVARPSQVILEAPKGLLSA